MERLLAESLRRWIKCEISTALGADPKVAESAFRDFLDADNKPWYKRESQEKVEKNDRVASI